MSLNDSFNCKLKEHRKDIFETNDNGSEKFLPIKAAEKLMEEYDFLTVDENEEIFVRNGSMYHDRGESVIKQEVQRVLPKGYGRVTTPKSQTISTICDWTRIKREEFREDPRYINLENGVFDLETDEFIEEEANFLFRHKVPVKYDEDAWPEKTLDIIRDIVVEENIPLIQEMFGYCLYRDYPFNKAFMLLGNGANGKTTILNILQNFLGNDNIANPSLQALLERHYNDHNLFKKLANINADIPDRSLKNTSKFKKLTGEDMIFAEKKHSNDALQFKNYAKLIYSANDLPETHEFNDAFFRRWIIIDFPYKFTSDPEDGCKTKDPDILKGLFTDEEMSGLFNWALQGLKRIFRNNGFSTSDSTKNVKKEWLLRTDSLRSFCEYHCEEDPDYFVPKDEFMKVYKYYCKVFDIRYKSKNKVGRELPKVLAVDSRRKRISSYENGFDSGPVRVWVGLKLKDLGFLSDDFDELDVFKDVDGGFEKVGLLELKGDEVVDDGLGFGGSDLLEVLPSQGEGMAVEMVFEEFPDVDNDKIGEVLDELVRKGDVVEQFSGFYKKV